MNCGSAQSCKSRFCFLVLLFVSTAVGSGTGEGPPFPRIANVYGTALTADGARFHGENRTLEEVARYDLLVGVRSAASETTRAAKCFGSNWRNSRRSILISSPCISRAVRLIRTSRRRKRHLASRQPGQIVPWLLQTDGQPIAGWPGTYMLNMAAPGRRRVARAPDCARRPARSATTGSSSIAWALISTVGPAKSPPGNRTRSTSTQTVKTTIATS